jgi:hypothetical protein
LDAKTIKVVIFAAKEEEEEEEEEEEKTGEKVILENKNKIKTFWPFFFLLRWTGRGLKFTI